MTIAVDVPRQRPAVVRAEPARAAQVQRGSPAAAAVVVVAAEIAEVARAVW
jgi:hypothetical protein